MAILHSFAVTGPNTHALRLKPEMLRAAASALLGAADAGDFPMISPDVDVVEAE